MLYIGIKCIYLVHVCRVYIIIICIILIHIIYYNMNRIVLFPIYTLHVDYICTYISTVNNILYTDYTISMPM